LAKDEEATPKSDGKDNKDAPKLDVKVEDVTSKEIDQTQNP
jgi:hypothetical protein